MEGVGESIGSMIDIFHWQAEIEGQEREWDAKVIEQTPDQCIVVLLVSATLRQNRKSSCYVWP
jgi:hypothetical protein